MNNNQSLSVDDQETTKNVVYDLNEEAEKYDCYK